MDKIYQPNHLWKGQKAVKKLKELSEEKQWLSMDNNGYLGKHVGKYIYQLLSELIDLITR